MLVAKGEKLIDAAQRDKIEAIVPVDQLLKPGHERQVCQLRRKNQKVAGFLIESSHFF
ncbi:MAG: hypothetical protein K0A93_10760 [Desulfuromonadaceae bacterium]|nr:hypothetical protein [Desulfuromonadaceae bacterium]